MLIQCTKKLLEELGLSCRWLTRIGKTAYPGGLYDWHAALAVIAGQKMIVLMNNLSRYPVVILLTKENAADAMKDAVLETMRREGIHPAAVECYGALAGMPVLEKTSSRELTQKLHYAVRQVQACGYLAEPAVLLQHKMSREAARKQVLFETEYQRPLEVLAACMEQMLRMERPDVPFWDTESFVFRVCEEAGTDTGVFGSDGCSSGSDGAVFCASDLDREAELMTPSNVTLAVFHELLLHLFEQEGSGEYLFLADGCVQEKTRELRELGFEEPLYWCPHSADSRKTRYRIRLVRQIRSQSRPSASALMLRGGGGYRRRSLREINRELRWIMMR